MTFDEWAEKEQLFTWSPEGEWAERAWNAQQQRIAELEAALKEAYKRGFMASTEGFNGAFPFEHDGRDPEEHEFWVQEREDELNYLLADRE